MMVYVGIDQMSWLSVSHQKSTGADFKAWANKYLALDVIGCSEDDLWAARNGLLHMGNTEARDVQKGKAKKIYYLAGAVKCTRNQTADSIFIHEAALITGFIAGAAQFLLDLEADAAARLTAETKADSILARRSATELVK